MPSPISRKELLPELKALGANVRRTRVNKNMTQEKLAEDAGIGTRTVQKIEAGQINILTTTLRRIRNALGCKWGDLLD